METQTEAAGTNAGENWFKQLWKRMNSREPKRRLDGNDVDLLEPLLPHADPANYQRYAGAFETIIKKDVTCVAITGPYGSGKTSLINRFRQEYPEFEFISISLATFEDDEEKRKIDPDEIQQSILQQLIYSTSEDELEYSRFKRIRKPKGLWWKAVVFGAFAILTGAAALYWDEIEKFVTESKLWWEYGIAVAAWMVWAALFVAIIRGVLKASVGQSIRKFSLKNAEIETEQQSQESVFNKNLDEIIYFFQEVPCDILVIEDLDRFEKTEIYTKICEINRLINENRTIKKNRAKPIVFLFAIRDELFEGEERTKIFDMLIPVIPFVSAGNAYDVLHNKLGKAGLRTPLNTRFLREVAVYVTDHRYLVNIVNEYAVYCRNLLEATLDPNKLFAVILYKVFYPEDFGKLHKNEGALAVLVRDLREQRRKKRDVLDEELALLDEAEKALRQGMIASREGLATAYIGVIARQFDQRATGFRTINSSQGHEFSEKVDMILQFWEENSSAQITDTHGRNLGTIQRAEIEEIVHPGLTLDERITEIDRIKRFQEDGLAAKRQKLTELIRDIRYLPMKDAFSAEEVREKSAKLETSGLFVYLVTKGCLCEDYDNYISYFHEGATTRADREFIQRFHSDFELEFSERVDTPSEVLLILDDGLFGKPQGFNIAIVDYVLEKADLTHQRRLVSGMKAFPESAFQFLEFYYDEGKHPQTLVKLLVKGWKGFLDSAASCEHPLPHVQAILEKTSDETLTNLQASKGFSQFIERNAPDVFDSPQITERLPLLARSRIQMNDISFPTLDEKSRSNAIKNIAEHTLWKINPDNIATLLDWQGVNENTANSAMFQSLEKASDSVYQYIEANINNFVENCFLEVESTAEEPQESLERLLSIEDLDYELGVSIIARQKVRIRFGGVPESYRRAIKKHEKYLISWENFEEVFQATGSFDAVSPVFLSSDTIGRLSKEAKVSEKLFGHLVDFEDMSLNNYEKLIGPKLGEIAELPTSISREKKLHLIASGMIGLDKKAHDWLAGEEELQVALFVNQYSTFEAEIEEWSLGEAEVVGLLKSRIPSAGKRRILRMAGTMDCSEDENLCTEVVKILTDLKTNIDEFDEDFVESVIASAPQDGAIELLVRMIPKWPAVRVMSNLKTIGSPYDEIAGYRNRPTIKESALHMALAQALIDRGFISQFKNVKAGIKIITKHSEPSD